MKNKDLKIDFLEEKKEGKQIERFAKIVKII